MTDGGEHALCVQPQLDAIEEYNHVDCDSSLMLRDWLLERRAECDSQYGVEIPWRPSGAHQATPETEAADDETLALTEALLEGLPDESDITDPDERSRWLLAQLLDYHGQIRLGRWP